MFEANTRNLQELCDCFCGFLCVGPYWFFLLHWYVGAKSSSTDAVQVSDNVWLHCDKEYPFFFFALEFYDTDFSCIIKCRNKTLSLCITLKITLFFLNYWFCEIVVLAKLLYLCCLCIFLKIDDSLNVKPVVTLEDPVLFVLTNSSYT